ncbi:hypothetical protein AUC43_05680 [Hymenobacter sedentarius]|uniref:Uncharacterized protein n=1 Tax=Hymenobacter sedentarius TaxID=1411621 RepID=A0A0U4BDG8_9BACT|nr:hypothetical protein [Hymenobacter sedentarius]ALW84619.1 hypothetical protein AUC43_05680 [Hymenobacter sedentarius]
MFALMRLMIDRGRGLGWFLVLLGLGANLSACQPHTEAEVATTPPVGHYEGSLSVAGQPEVRAALDIRHPSHGHYEAELTVPTAGTLSFVADTIIYRNNQLRLTRPARPSEVLTLSLDGDFWRGALTLDTTKVKAILVKRSVPTPSTYRIEELPQAAGSAWLFAPSDTGTPGPALILLPDSTAAPTAALWGDALAREGIIVLVLPATDSATATAETPRLRAAVRLLHNTPGADTSNVGAWVAGARATALAQALAAPGSPRVAFVIAQNADLSPAGKAAFRELKEGRKLPLLGLYSGPASAQRAAALRNALGGRRGAAVRAYRTAGPDLFVPAGLNPQFGPGLPGDILEWMRAR